MPDASEVLLTGTIELEGDVYVSVCHELDISTCGGTLEEALRSTVDMLAGYFDACLKLGTLDDVLRRLAHRPVSPHVIVRSRFDLGTIAPPSAFFESTQELSLGAGCVFPTGRA